MSKLTSAQHASEAERLLGQSRTYRRNSEHPDAAGSAIRAGWARQADQLLAEAQVHAALAAATQEVAK